MALSYVFICFNTKNMVIVTFIPFHPLTHGIPSDQVLQLLQVLWWISQPALLPDPGDSLVKCWSPQKARWDFDTLQVLVSYGFIPSWTVRCVGHLSVKAVRRIWEIWDCPPFNPTKFIQTMLAIGSRFGMLQQAAPRGFAPAVPATNPLGWE